MMKFLGNGSFILWVHLPSMIFSPYSSSRIISTGNGKFKRTVHIVSLVFYWSGLIAFGVCVDKHCFCVGTPFVFPTAFIHQSHRYWRAPSSARYCPWCWRRKHWQDRWSSYLIKDFWVFSADLLLGLYHITRPISSQLSHVRREMLRAHGRVESVSINKQHTKPHSRLIPLGGWLDPCTTSKDEESTETHTFKAF